MSYKTIQSGYLLSVLLLTPFSTNGIESADSNNVNSNGSVRKPATLQTEEEIWVYLDQLCIEHPTARCSSDQYSIVRNGGVFDLDEELTDPKTFQSKSELVKFFINRQVSQNSGN